MASFSEIVDHEIDCARSAAAQGISAIIGKAAAANILNSGSTMKKIADSVIENAKSTAKKILNLADQQTDVPASRKLACDRLRTYWRELGVDMNNQLDKIFGTQASEARSLIQQKIVSAGRDFENLLSIAQSTKG